MQPGWLNQYFKPQDGVDGEQTGERRDETAPAGDVSRRDFVKSGFVAGVAAGMAAGSVAGNVVGARRRPRTRWATSGGLPRGGRRTSAARTTG
jgi:hypothetical protein